MYKLAMADTNASMERTIQATQASHEAAQQSAQASHDDVSAAPTTESPPEIHPGHPDHNAMDTGLPSSTPRASGSNAAGQAG
jgi:hypothetical protein